MNPLGWWAISGDALLAALKRAHNTNADTETGE